MDLQTVLHEIDSWPVEDRIRLMGEIWDSLHDQGYEPELSDELKAELDRRVAELDAHPDDVVPWQEVLDRAWRRFGR
jgi:putative addiction module component (TIGR02574 family)